LPELDNDFSERVRAVFHKSRDYRARGVGSIVVPHLYFVREDGDPSLKLWAQTLLVEDRVYLPSFNGHGVLHKTNLVLGGSSNEFSAVDGHAEREGKLILSCWTN
jgi:hypothetical protein